MPNLKVSPKVNLPKAVFPKDPGSFFPCPGWSCLMLSILLCLPMPAMASNIVLGSPFEESPPTSEDLNGIAAAPTGESIVVGNNATVLRRTLDTEGNPTWTSLGSWADDFFRAELFEVAHSPATYAGGEAWVIAGRGGVVETDFVTTLEVDLRPESNAVFTPVLPTADEIWYGVPDLGAFPSFLHRYDRTTQTAPGIAFPVGAVLAMCQVPGGNLRFVTTDGDIEEIDDNLQITTLFDQPDGQSLELNAASFSEDCEVISAGDAGPESRIYAGFLEILAAPAGAKGGPDTGPWRHVSRPGEPIVTASCFLTPEEQHGFVGLFAFILRCNDSVATGDDTTMQAFADLLQSRILNVQSFNADEKCQRRATIRPVSNQLQGSLRGSGASFDPGFEILSVGTQGRVQRILGAVTLVFEDGFESGDLSAWSLIAP